MIITSQVVFVNKMDRENSTDKVLETSVKVQGNLFRSNSIGSFNTFAGVVDVV